MIKKIDDAKKKLKNSFAYIYKTKHKYMRPKSLLVILIAITIISLFNTCKKYPENTLWFKTPYSAINFTHIKNYTIDGIDSIPMWNTIYNTPPYGGFPAHNELWDITAFSWRVDTKINEIYSDLGAGSFHLFNNKKELYMFFKMYTGIDGQIPKNNIFYSEESNWKIIKLTKDGNLKIQRTYNNKVYEIEFN